MNKRVIVPAVVVVLGGGCNPFSGLKTCPSDPSCPGHTQSSQQKATCNATRLECKGWSVASDGSRFCDPSNLVTVSITGASACFDPAAQTSAQACFSAVCGPSSTDYPFDTITNPNICKITSSSAVAANAGECVHDSEPVTNSTDRFNDCLQCQQNGRLCTQQFTTNTGGKVCTALAEYHDPVTMRYADLNTFSGLVVCRNDAVTFPGSAVGGLVPVEFTYEKLAGVTLNVPPGGSSVCGTRSTSTGVTTGYLLPAQPLGTVSMPGQSNGALTLQGGFATTGSVCPGGGDVCLSAITKLRLSMGTLAFAGTTIRNAQLESTDAMLTTNSGVATGEASFELSGDIDGLGHAAALVTNSSPLTVSSSSSSITIAGNLSYLARVSANSYMPIALSLSASGSASSTAGGCASATALANLLGFETTQYWSSSQVALSLTATRKTQGCFAIQVGGSGFRTLDSSAFATPLPGATSTLALDVFVPANQPNPSWLGAVQTYLSCPAEGVNNAFIGQAELTGKPVGAFSMVTFALPSSLLSVLQGTHNDCFFSVAVNTNATPDQPVLDNLRFM
jgi:hypothetical protein